MVGCICISDEISSSKETSLVELSLMKLAHAEIEFLCQRLEVLFHYFL